MKTTKKLKGCQKGLKSFLIYPFGTLKVLFGKRVGNLRNDDRFLQDRKKKHFRVHFRTQVPVMYMKTAKFGAI